MNDLTGKKALVTGGASGIGAAISGELAALGAEVAVHYHSSAEGARELTERIEQIGGRAMSVGGDLTDESQVQEMVRTVAERFGSLDILVNNSGDMVARCPVDEISVDFYRKVQAVNMDSAVMVTREALPLLRTAAGERTSPGSGDRQAAAGATTAADPDTVRRGASIINISSLAGRKGGAGGSLAYASAKGAMLAFTRGLATELAADGIRVNAVCPGLILGSRFHEVHTSDEAKQRTIAGIPLGRAGTCEEVARAVAFLASEYNGFITGTSLDINGGAYMA